MLKQMIKKMLMGDKNISEQVYNNKEQKPVYRGLKKTRGGKSDAASEAILALEETED